ncbi:protein tag [Mactra antiquata]
MSSVTDEDGPPKSKSGLRGLRGLALKKTLIKENSTGSGLYTGCVKKCFDALSSGTVSEEVIQDIESTKDVVEEIPEYFSKPRSPPLLPKTDNVIPLSDDEVDEELECQDNLSEIINTLAPSSPPPPPPPKQNNKRKGRSTKAAQKRSGGRSTRALTKRNQELEAKVIQARENYMELLESPNTSQDICVIDDDVTVRISIHGQIQRFTVSCDHPFEEIISMIASKENVQDSQVILVHNDKTLKSNDTPSSVQLHTADILECYINATLDDSFTPDSSSQNDPNVIELVVQSQSSKRRELINAHLEKPLSYVIDEYAKRMKSDACNIQLYFDGELVSPKSTPQSLDIEDGDVLDVKEEATIIL